MTEQNNRYLSRSLRELKNLLIYFNSCMRETKKTISLIEEAIEAKNETL
jgi:hypothetical protein